MWKLRSMDAIKVRAMKTLRPKTKMGRLTLWSGGLTLCVVLLHLAEGLPLRSLMSGWADFFFIDFLFCAWWVSCRWVWRKMMWRLRYRLLVTYVFMGFIPIVLLLLLVGVAAYLFAGQFAGYVAISNLQSASLHLRAENDVLASHLSALERSGKLDSNIAGKLTAELGGEFSQRTVTVWHGLDGFVIAADGTPLKTPPAKVPDSIKGAFSGVVVEHDTLYLRAVRFYYENGERLAVISSVPITPRLLRSATSSLGLVTLFPPGLGNNVQIPPPPNASGAENNIVKAGTVPAASNQFDRSFRFYTVFNAMDWENGESEDGALGVVTRPSALYNTLFASFGDKALILEYGLLVIVILLGLVELVALFIGIRLTRSVTGSVAELYNATEHVNRGDLMHRIQIRGHDQMAVLEHSFNSMSESLVKLVAEQKQKQRMESELAFAYEVQDLLFPHKFAEHTSLEVFGVCRPARSVSGDYYDFIPLGSDRLVLAVGDISGKGISAALLMASVHAFVRAYSLAPDLVSTSAVLGSGVLSNVDHRMYSWGGGTPQLRLSPATLMTTLNYQLVRCTPPEKYATMFLGCYDATTHELTYCNAGHLPPIVLNMAGDVARLEASGTVAGMFDNATYSESKIPMLPGDLFVAFSDGVTEPESDLGEFGEDRLIDLIQAHRDEPLSHIGNAITEAVVQWIGDAEQPDDVTVVLARAR